MNALSRIDAISTLPSLVKKAADRLASAATAAEILDARDMASVAYDAAKKAARMARAKQAHDEIIAKVAHAQADALEIEATAKRRLADEYDAAQERGEVASNGQRGKAVPDGNGFSPPTAADIGITRKEVHDARQIRDAEKIQPGIVRRVLDERIASGQEPNRAALREAVIEVARRGQNDTSGTPSRNPLYQLPTVNGAAWTHLYGACRALSEWSEKDENMIAALRGMKERRDDQKLNVAAVRKCAATLNRFLGELEDAQ